LEEFAMATFRAAYLNRKYTRHKACNPATLKGRDGLNNYKIQDGGGEAIVSRFQLTGNRGMAGSLAVAQSIAFGASEEGATGQFHSWLIPHGTLEGSIPLLVKDMRLSKRAPEAEARRLDNAVKVGLGEQGQRISDYIFGAAKKTLGQAQTVTVAAPGVLVFSNDPSAAAAFQKGDRIIAANATTDALENGGAAVIVDFTNTETGTVTFTTALPGAWSTADAFYREGDFFPSDPTAIVIGLSDFIPNTALTTTLAGVNRAASSLLSGVRVPTALASNLSIAARIRKLAAYAKKVAGWQPGDGNYVAILSPEDFDTMVSQLGVQVEREQGVEAKDGFPAVRVTSAVGSIICIGEAAKENGSFFLCAREFLTLWSPDGEIASFINEDGNILSRVATSNTMELRPVSYLAHDVGPIYKHGRGSTL
jgi:hypothetical protein